jgi:hypothetical protein
VYPYTTSKYVYVFLKESEIIQNHIPMPELSMKVSFMSILHPWIFSKGSRQLFIVDNHLILRWMKDPYGILELSLIYILVGRFLSEPEEF